MWPDKSCNVFSVNANIFSQSFTHKYFSVESLWRVHKCVLISYMEKSFLASIWLHHTQLCHIFKQSVNAKEKSNKVLGLQPA